MNPTWMIIQPKTIAMCLGKSLHLEIHNHYNFFQTMIESTVFSQWIFYPLKLKVQHFVCSPSLLMTCLLLLLLFKSTLQKENSWITRFCLLTYLKVSTYLYRRKSLKWSFMRLQNLKTVLSNASSVNIIFFWMLGIL